MPKHSGKMNDRERAICGRLRSFREAIRWPQSDFAKELGVSRDKLASVEYGRTPLRYDLGAVVCRVFDLNAEWLAAGHGPQTGYSWQLWTREQRAVFNDSWLFSAVYDLYPGAFRGKAIKVQSPFVEEPCFEPKNYLVQAMLHWFDVYKFTTEEAARQFAVSVDQCAHSLLRDHQHAGTAVRRLTPTMHFAANAIAAKELLTNVSVLVTSPSVKSPLKDLLRRAELLTREPGKKTELAALLGVPLASVSRWLSGKREPGGETTLKLLKWVQEHENPSIGNNPATKRDSTNLR